MPKATSKGSSQAQKRGFKSVDNATPVEQEKNKRQFSGSVTNLIDQKVTHGIPKEKYIPFFNLIADIPNAMKRNEYERHTQNKYNNEKADEIFYEHQRNINKLVEVNPTWTREYAEELYWESLGTTPLAMKFVRGDYLVSEDDYKNLPEQLRQLHEYYMCQALGTTDFGFDFIIPSLWVYFYPDEEHFSVKWECLFQLFHKCNLNVQILSLWTM